MAIKTILRKTSCRRDEHSPVEEFSYYVIDVNQYLAIGEPALAEGAKVVSLFVKSSADIKAQTRFRTLRRPTKTRAAMSHDAACKYMLDEYECIPGTRPRVDHLVRTGKKAAKLSDNEKLALMQQLARELGMPVPTALPPADADNEGTPEGKDTDEDNEEAA